MRLRRRRPKPPKPCIGLAALWKRLVDGGGHPTNEPLPAFVLADEAHMDPELAERALLYAAVRGLIRWHKKTDSFSVRWLKNGDWAWRS